MARTRSIKLALLTVALLAGFGTTFAWASGLVGGRRADHIGTFTPTPRPATATTARGPGSTASTTRASQTSQGDPPAIGRFATTASTTSTPDSGPSTPRATTATAGNPTTAGSTMTVSVPGAVRPTVTSRPAPAPTTTAATGDRDDSPGRSTAPTTDDDDRTGDD